MENELTRCKAYEQYIVEAYNYAIEILEQMDTGYDEQVFNTLFSDILRRKYYVEFKTESKK